MISEYQKIEAFKYVSNKLKEVGKVISFDSFITLLRYELQIHPELYKVDQSELHEHAWQIAKIQIHYRDTDLF